MKHLVTTDWLENNLSNVRVFDASWHLPHSNRSGFEEFKSAHIKNANFFDIEKNSNQKSSLPHMLPNKKDWEVIKRLVISQKWTKRGRDGILWDKHHEARQKYVNKILSFVNISVLLGI